ncbi:MAG: thiamine pyrophosphate-dependent enzyme [Deferrisomatales bacterium]
MSDRRDVVWMGNEAIAWGLLESGCQSIAAYPGTPSSEILEAAARWKRELALDHVHVEWSINEKVAFETAYAASMAGKRSAVAMKMVGLNVAADPFLSAAYMGLVGGMVVIVADDPGPHSSQTEQDSRLFAWLAKVPVLDPASPAEARRMVARALELSERYRVPVMLRPTTRVCHARETMEAGELPAPTSLAPAAFRKDPPRWTATPRFRYLLHAELEEKLDRVRTLEASGPRLTGGSAEAPRAVVASGLPWAHLSDLLEDEPALAEGLAVYKVDLAFPQPTAELASVLDRHGQVLVLEETDPVVELQFPCRDRVRGRLDGSVPRAGELTPEVIAGLVGAFAGEPVAVPEGEAAPGRRPSLCAGCGHRSAFYALRRAFPKGILTGDIGCYTLGMNLGGVDAFICMGGGVALAAGLYHAYRSDGLPDAEIPPIAATIGDSTFFHSGLPPLLNAVHQGARIVVVVLDNGTTGMTGHQPTPGTGVRAAGDQGPQADIAEVCRGLGSRWVRVADPYEGPRVMELLREAHGFCRSPEGTAAVLVLKRPCIQLAEGRDYTPVDVGVLDACDGCGACLKLFECPAFRLPEGAGRMEIDRALCARCGQCIQVCPKGAIVAQKGGER